MDKEPIMVYEVTYIHWDRIGPVVTQPEIRIMEVPINSTYKPFDSFRTSNGGLHHVEKYRFNTLWEAQDFASRFRG